MMIVEAAFGGLSPEICFRPRRCLSPVCPNNKVITHLGYDPEWTKQVLGDGKFPVRSNTALWQTGRFIHPHDACFDKLGNLFVVEWVPTGRVSFLRHVG